MDDAKSLAWKVVAGLAALFLLTAALLWGFARTTPGQQNARAAEAAGVTVQAPASGSEPAPAAEPADGAQPTESESTGSEPASSDPEGAENSSDSADPSTGQGEVDGEEAALAGQASNTDEVQVAEVAVHPAFDVGTGEELYAAACQSCHMPGGVGVDQGAGTKNYPALAGNANLQSPQYPATFILNGAGAMPSFADQLNDEQVAMLINYLRSDLNDFDGEVTPQDIEPLREGARSTTLGAGAG